MSLYPLGASLQRRGQGEVLSTAWHSRPMLVRLPGQGPHSFLTTILQSHRASEHLVTSASFTLFLRPHNTACERALPCNFNYKKGAKGHELVTCASLSVPPII